MNIKKKLESFRSFLSKYSTNGTIITAKRRMVYRKGTAQSLYGNKKIAHKVAPKKRVYRNNN